MQAQPVPARARVKPCRRRHPLLQTGLRFDFSSCSISDRTRVLLLSASLVVPKTILVWTHSIAPCMNMIGRFAARAFCCAAASISGGLVDPEYGHTTFCQGASSQTN